jgi:AraC family transcriptional regulator of adaptative response / DNA-3-methyladenine glycosylase II
MADIAFAAGFQSVRQFNHALRETFQETPTEPAAAASDARYRRHRLAAALPPAVRLGCTHILSRPRATTGVEVVESNAYRRTVEIDGRAAIITVTPVPGERYLSLHIESESHHGLIGVVERVRRLFDLGADPLEVSDKLRRSVCSRHSSRRGRACACRAPDPFELATRAVLGQQVTVQGATTLASRLVRQCGRRSRPVCPG